MKDQDSPPSLDNLADRVKRARGEEKDAKRDALTPGLSGSAMSIAFRVGVELVAGVMVGAAIGYGLDQFLGTSPWMLIVFFFLGAAGGMMNVYRAATSQSFAVGYRETDDEQDQSEDGGQSGGGKREG